MENTYLNKLILPLCDKGASISMLCQAARNGLMQILFVSRMILGGEMDPFHHSLESIDYYSNTWVDNPKSKIPSGCIIVVWHLELKQSLKDGTRRNIKIK